MLQQLQVGSEIDWSKSLGKTLGFDNFFALGVAATKIHKPCGYNIQVT